MAGLKDKLDEWTRLGFEVLVTDENNKIVFINSVFEKYFNNCEWRTPLHYEDYMYLMSELSPVRNHVGKYMMHYIHRAVRIRASRTISYMLRFYLDGTVAFGLHMLWEGGFIVTVRDKRTFCRAQMEPLNELRSALLFGVVPTAVVQRDGAVVASNLSLEALTFEIPELIGYGEFGLEMRESAFEAQFYGVISDAIEHGREARRQVSTVVLEPRAHQVEFCAHPVRLPTPLTNETFAAIKIFNPSFEYTPSQAICERYGTDAQQSEVLIGLLHGHSPNAIAGIIEAPPGTVDAAIARAKLASGVRTMPDLISSLREFAPFARL